MGRRPGAEFRVSGDTHLARNQTVLALRGHSATWDTGLSEHACAQL